MRFLALLTILFTTKFSYAEDSFRSITLQNTDTGHFVTDVTINGVTRKFIIDTGSSGSVIDLALVSELKLTEEQGKTVRGAAPGNAEMVMKRYSVPHLSIDGLLKTSVTFVGQDIASAFPPLNDGLLGGIIGLEILSAHELLFDVSNAKLMERHDIAAKSILLIKQANMNMPVVSAKINGKPVKLLLDSGATHVILDKEFVTTTLAQPIDYSRGIQSFDMAGNARPIGMLQASDIELANLALESDVFVDELSQIFSHLHSKGTPEVEKTVGLLGLQTLSKLNAVIDLQGNRVIFREE